VVFNETLQCNKVFSVLLSDFYHFLKVFVQFFNFMLSLAVRVELELFRERIIERFIELLVFVEYWRLRLGLFEL